MAEPLIKQYIAPYETSAYINVILDMGRNDKLGMFSWTKSLVRLVVQRILDTVLWPSQQHIEWSISKSLPDLRMRILSTMGGNGHEMPPSKSQSSL